MLVLVLGIAAFIAADVAIIVLGEKKYKRC